MAYFAEIRTVAFATPPKNWALCNGQLLPIEGNHPLFALLGSTHGGDARTTFALPNLDGRVLVGTGDHPLGTTETSVAAPKSKQRLGSVALTHIIATYGTFPPGEDFDRSAFVGEIRLFANTYVPRGWIPCDGRAVSDDQYPQLSGVLKNAFGGKVPDLRGRVPVGAGKLALGATGEVSISPQAPPNASAARSVAMNYAIAADGIESEAFSPYLGEVRAFAFKDTPEGWATCWGGRIPINNNTFLFSLISDNYGGDGRQTFELPKLAGRVAIGADAKHPLGSTTGSADVDRNGQPFLVVNYCISMNGMFPPRPES